MMIQYFIRNITSLPAGQGELIALHIMKNGQEEPVEIFEKKTDAKFFDSAWSRCNKLNKLKRLSYAW